VLINYNFIESLNNFIKLSLGLNLILVGCYLLKENIILNESESLKYFFIACTCEYLLVSELAKLVGKPQELTLYYTKYIYFGLLLLQLGLYQRFSKVIQRFIKFSFGFCFDYALTFIFLYNYNFIHVLVSLALSTIWNYVADILLVIMVICCTHLIYFVTIYEGIYILIITIHIKNSHTIAVIKGFCNISNVIIILYRLMSQVESSNNNDDDEDLEGEKISDIV
jgi:hypothetical protein